MYSSTSCRIYYIIHMLQGECVYLDIFSVNNSYKIPGGQDEIIADDDISLIAFSVNCRCAKCSECDYDTYAKRKHKAKRVPHVLATLATTKSIGICKSLFSCRLFCCSRIIIVGCHPLEYF